ncbi:hypothetical protein BDV93DRAFT_524538 [Ceratobasidium sp. AG-I]|nr:hypothetical protein BDV93DRAFT_524538 [Ceratobasidium sp. AG-I]
MASAYASPPRSTREMSSTPAPSTSTSAPSIESSLQALAQPPPPTLRDILHAYASQAQGDRTLLIALLNAKSAEDNRIAAVAALQQNILHIQLGVVASQLQTQSRARETSSGRSWDSEVDSIASPLSSPSPSVGKRPARHGSQGAYTRAHPYAKARPERRASSDDQTGKKNTLKWSPPRSWDFVSDERSTSDGYASGGE